MLSNVDAKERFEVIGLCDGIYGLEMIAQFLNEDWMTCRNGKVVNMNAKIYALAG